MASATAIQGVLHIVETRLQIGEKAGVVVVVAGTHAGGGWTEGEEGEEEEAAIDVVAVTLHQAAGLRVETAGMVRGGDTAGR